MMVEQNAQAFPESPMEMATWVRDRSIKVVEELTKVIAVIRDDSGISEELQNALHFPISAALANAIKLAAFSSGHHLSGDEVSALIGSIYKSGNEGIDELIVRLASLEEPVSRRLIDRQ